jgi:two-component system OmpR family response regulator
MRVLLAEDDAELAASIVRSLGDSGLAVVHCRDGVDAEFRGQTEDFDCVVLDLGLPAMEGLAVLESWRAHGLRIPVLILTARARWHDKLAGFGAGADDYLVKPFLIDELVLRVRALIRRSLGHAHPLLVAGGLVLDDQAARFRLNGRELALTAHEFRILAYLMHHRGRVVSRIELGEHVYQQGYDPDSNVLDVLLSRIRRKIGGNRILTERGRGFRLVALE